MTDDASEQEAKACREVLAALQAYRAQSPDERAAEVWDFSGSIKILEDALSRWNTRAADAGREIMQRDLLQTCQVSLQNWEAMDLWRRRATALYHRLVGETRGDNDALVEAKDATRAFLRGEDTGPASPLPADAGRGKDWDDAYRKLALLINDIPDNDHREEIQEALCTLSRARSPVPADAGREGVAELIDTCESLISATGLSDVCQDEIDAIVADARAVLNKYRAGGQGRREEAGDTIPAKGVADR